MRKISQCVSFLRVVTLPFVFLLFSCEEKSNDSPGEDLSLSDLRLAFASGLSDHFILPAYQNLAESALLLNQAANNFRANQTRDQLEALRLQLSEIWHQWQKVELFQFGPAETSALRSSINTYPASGNKIENNIRSGSYTLGAISQLDAGGFPAVDYLINNPDLSEMDLLDTFSNDPARMKYLSDLVQHISSNITSVESAWNQSDFLTNFRSKNSSGTDVGSALGIFINSVDLHFQRFLRDGKVAIPAGIRSAGIIRPTATEAFYGGYSKSLLLQSLRTYQEVFEGNGAHSQKFPSLYTYLERLDRNDLVMTLKNAFSQVIAQTNTLRDPLSLQITEDVEPVKTLFILLQEVVTLIKADAVSAMGITITNQDNDGD